MNLPDYNFLSAPLWLIQILHWLTLTLHFVAMNFVVGGLAIVLWGKFTDRFDHPVVTRFIRLFPVVMAATVTLGVAPLLFVQLTYHEQIYSGSIVSAWWWLGIFIAVIIAYYLLYAASFAKEGRSPKRGLFLGLALIGLVYVSFVYSSVFSLAETPEEIRALYAGSQAGMQINPHAGAYIFRWLHMLFGALTVGGFFIGLIGRDHEEAFKVGKMFFAWGTAAAAVAGLAYIFTLGDYLVPYMKSPAVWVLMVGIILALGALHFFFKKKLWIAGTMVFVAMLAMVINRHFVRQIHLEGVWNPATMAFQPQWGIFILFVICFLIALGTIWYMLRLYFAGKDTPAGA